MPIYTASERIGSLVDRKYRLERILGHGGMGVVYESLHTWTGRKVAIKLLFPDLVEPARNQRLVAEARATAALNHPNVIQVFDMGLTEDGVAYLVMELLEGRSLKEELAARARLPPAEALALLLPLFGAMAVAHERGIIHRDIKPANIFLSRGPSGRMTPKLLDFGIAKLAEQTGITKSGMMVGTPHYLAPEQASGAEVTQQADVWAFGVTLYECLSGRLPFAAADKDKALARALSEPPDPLQDHAPEVGSGLAAAVERALQRSPAHRYADLREFARGLLSMARAGGIPLPADPDPIGLPDFAQWSDMDLSAVQATKPAGRARRVTQEPGVAPARPGRLWRIGMGIVLLVAAALSAALASSRSEAPARPIMNEPTVDETPAQTFRPQEPPKAEHVIDSTPGAQPETEPAAPAPADRQLGTPRRALKSERKHLAPPKAAAGTNTLIQEW